MDMLLFFRTSCRTLGRRSAASLIALLLVGWSSAANAIWALGMVPGVYIPQSYYKHGAVYTRAIVLSPAGNPYYVEYDNSGNEGREIAEKTGEYERAQIMAGAYYRSLLQRLADTKQRYPEHEEMTAAAYRGSSFKTVAGETIQKPSIAPNTLTVLVRAQNERYLKDGSDLLLLELPIKASVQPSASSQSLLLSEAGDILHQTANTIAFRVGFFGKDGKVATNLRRDHDSEIYGKMPSVPLSLGGYITGGFAITDADGKYRMNYFLPACPGFTFEYTTPVYLELYYSRFNPRGNSMMPYYLVRQDYDYCNGLSALSMWATLAMTTSATYVKPKFDFPVDLMVVDGAAAFADVQLGDKTAYNPETSDYAKTIQEAYDFDGDEKPEIMVPGKKVKKTVDGEEREVFVETAVAEAELQGIYLSSRHSAKPASTEDTAPDFTRLIDTTADFKDRGMLQSISKDDLRDTDIYVFRESTGQLVAERRGLHENELYKTYSGVDDKQGSFRFTIQLRGAVENTYALAGRNGEANFTKWQSAGGFTEEFQKRTANHLKSGEQVRIIAINRPTGYMGSARINLNASLNGNMIDLNQARIQLTPPNLKIWAERKNKIEQGMTRGEEKKQLIGNEGAGLGSDISIAIYSDWRDQDGGPLPEALADYGYTGRLAKIVSANQLAPVGANNLSQFKIKPGQQVQVIQLPEKVLAKQHLYLQVAGQPENRNPDFATGNGEGILKYRPSKYVPVQVPLHDEEASEIARQAYRKADRERPELNLKKPEPMYSWQYRPEMQFSLYELNLREVRRVDAGGLIEQVYQDNKPVIANSDKLLEFYYDLLRSEFGELQAYSYSGEKELVLAVGEHEVKVTFGKGQNLKFENLAHLSYLDVDDFLTVRLYTNNDQGNSLIDWAFEYLNVFADEDEEINERGEYYFLSADNPVVDIKAVLAGYYSRREEIKRPETLRWGVEGVGSVSPMIDGSGDTGIFATTLSMPPKAGNRARVYANLQGSDAKAYFKEIIVVPGEVANITTSFSGGLWAGKMGELEATILITDRNGNIAVNGLGADLSIEGEGEVVEEEGVLIGAGDKVIIRNAQKAGDDNQLVVRVDGIERRFPFSVKPLVVTPPPVEDVYEDQLVDVRFDLSGLDPSLLKPGMFTVETDKGALLDKRGSIDSDGKLVFRWHTGYQLGKAKLFYNDTSGHRVSLEYNVLANPNSIFFDKKPVVLVTGVDGTLEVERVNGERVALMLPQQDQLRLKGVPGTVIPIVLGDGENPNKQALISLSAENLGRSQFVTNAEKLASAPGFRVQPSTHDGLPLAYNYKGYGLSLSDDAALEQAAAGEGLTFAMNFESAGEGAILAWRDLLSFELQQNQLVVKRKLNEAQFEEQRYPLPASTGSYHFSLSASAGSFAFALNGVAGEAQVDPAVAPAQGHAIRILAGKGMGLRRLTAMLRSAGPLILLAGQAESTSVTLDDKGEALLDIELSPGATVLGQQSIPVRVAGERFSVSLYTPEQASRLLSTIPMSQALSSETARIVLAKDVREANSFIPQTALALQTLASTAPAPEQIRALLSIFTSLPNGHFLAGKVGTLGSYAERSPVAFQHALRDVLASSISGYTTATSETNYKRMLALVVLAEIAQSNLDVSSYIADAATNTRDLQLWLDWMAMPANGWALFEPAVPYMEQSCTSQVVYAFEGTDDQTPYNPCRLSGEQFASWVAALKSAAPEYEESPELFLVLLEGLYKGLPEANYNFRRELFASQPESLGSFDPTSLFVNKAHAAGPAIPAALLVVARATAQLSKRLGKNFMRNLLKFVAGKSDTRIPPLLYIAATGFAWTSANCDDDGLLPCGPFSPLVMPGNQNKDEARKKINSSLIQFSKGLAFAFNRSAWRMTDTLKDNGAYRCSVLGFTHGHMYEMLMIAFYHGLDPNQIVALDRLRKVPLYGNQTDKKQMISRRPDIELKGGGDEKTNTWLELKSLSVTNKYDANKKPDLPSKAQFLYKLPAFAVPANDGKGESVYHRQFLLDRIANEGQYGGSPISMSGDFRWEVQHWKAQYKELKGLKVGHISNGIPTRTKIPNDQGTYFDAAKERLKEAPGFTAASQVKAKTFPVSGPYTGDAFISPLFGEVPLDEEAMAEEVLKALKYSAADIADIKRLMRDSGAAVEQFQKLAEKMPSVELGWDIDITEFIPDEILEQGRDYADEKLADYIGCEDDD